jgi:serine/threonine-protein kinase
MDQYIGKLLDNRYEILELIGSGGMSRVYKARCHRLNRLVAIKILREDLAQDAEFRRRFHDESQAVAMLSHPNIVAVYDVSRSSELEYIVMELIDGITLKQYMQRKGNKLNWREALHFMTQIVKALGHAHSRGIIHRDIKPHNVMVLRDGSVKVADFGIARLASDGHSTLTQEALGSVHYISPEQARGSRIDARSDLYSAGVVLYEMITGRLPFEGDTPVSVAIQHINSIPLSPREIDPSIPEGLETITMHAMAPDPNNRYSSADEMLEELEEFRKNPNINFDYTVIEMPTVEPSIDDKTRPIPQVSGGESRDRSRSSRSSTHRQQPRYEAYELDEEEDTQTGSPWMSLACVGVVLLFVVGVFFFLYRTFFSSMFQPAESYTVPDLLGYNYEDILDDESLLGRFTLVMGDSVANDAEAGAIIDQDPKADSSVGAAVTEIKVTVSAGPEVIYMPDLYNKEFRQAYTIIESLGLKTDTPVYEYNDEIGKGHIISFTPLAEAPLEPGSVVHLVISLGPKVKTVVLPSFVTMTQEYAESRIKNQNLVVGTITQVYSDTVEAGIVVDQYPAATTEVEEGSKVNLMVSKGPDPSKLPKDVTKTVYINLPDTGTEINVQVLMDGSVVYEGDADTTMDLSVAVTVTAPAGSTKTLIVYIDGVLDHTQTETFE